MANAGKECTMNKTVEALFDGTVLKPIEQLELEPNTQVWLIIKTTPPPAPRSFLQTARALNLDGPSDWSANLDDYLYGDKAERE
jgi:predicted DNA-binding antitoxin AbrB/MazE fold protein